MVRSDDAHLAGLLPPQGASAKGFRLLDETGLQRAADYSGSTARVNTKTAPCLNGMKLGKTHGRWPGITRMLGSFTHLLYGLKLEKVSYGASWFELCRKKLF